MVAGEGTAFLREQPVPEGTAFQVAEAVAGERRAVEQPN